QSVAIVAGTADAYRAGYSLPVYLTWCGLAAPANTPSAIVSKLNAVVGKVLELPAVRTKLLRVGYLPEPMTVEQFEHFIVEDWAAMIQFGQAAHIEGPINLGPCVLEVKPESRDLR